MIRRTFLALACVMSVANGLHSEEESQLDDTAFNEEQFVGYGLKAPAGLFKNVNDSPVRGVRLLRGTELFIDDQMIESMEGAWRLTISTTLS